MADANTDLARNKLGVGSIVFLVLAAVAPVTVLIVVLPLAIGLGNGGGVPISILLVAGALLLFAVGYAQITKELTNASGFYAIAVKGLGKTAGLITGIIATIGYNAFVAGALGTIGFFAGAVVFPELFGVELDWFLTALVLMVLVFLLARSGIHVSAIALGIALVVEILLVVVFGFSVLFTTGFDLSIFHPEVIMGGSLWIGLLLAATAFIGFEATALFGEEAKNPRKTIPRATYTAIIIIGLMHAFAAWAIISAIGATEAQGVALDHLESGDLTLMVIGNYLGPIGLTAALILVVVSLFAAQLAFHNSAARYLFSMGRARVLPNWLAKTNAKGSPDRALLVNALFAILIAAIFRFVLPDVPPILTLVPVGIGFATLAIIIVQAIAALSVVAYFRKKGDRRWWSTFIAPGLGFLALALFSIMALANFPTVAGSEEPYVVALPWILVAAVIGGIVYGAYLKAKKPDVYAGLSDDLEDFDEELREAAEAVKR
ncbi:APC family permease [Cryobacterium sp. PH29-G1]|uniref:APC family permease n=1 Tax=Cryobacterium sp. PH29-G1 TaxID=3046211 RepID=UPI0024B98428|nr:APC family permease [Cryobacterium sp. PH29-G1]MDJ0350450.1 APC family permease [Cryobacterium sp. PH29-G1]